LQTVSAGRTAALTVTSGTTVLPNDANTFGAFVTTAPTSSGWYSSNCNGYRLSTDTTTQLTSITVGTTVTYNVGFKTLATSIAVIPTALSPVSADLTYTIVDSAYALATSFATVAAMIAYEF